MIKKFFPIFLAQAILSVSTAGIMLNMLKMSYIIWEDETFHVLEMGLLISVRTWAMAISGLIIGYFADRYSRKKIFILIFAILGSSRLLNSFSIVGSNQAYLFFMICYLFTGIGIGGMQPLLISYINDIVETSERSQMFGKIEITKQLFQIIGMIMSTALFQLDLWRYYFGFGGFASLICSIYFIFKLGEPKRGSMYDSLKGVLANSKINYHYRINKETFSSTILSKSNLLIFLEGILTWIVFSIAMYMLYPYIQSPPYNISPLMTSIFMIIFGIPGAVIGLLIFTKLSDKLGEKNIIYRIYIIALSILLLDFLILAVFILPLPYLSEFEGNNFMFILKNPMYWALGLIVMLIQAFLGIYHINQSPLLQRINLPEGQGTISAWNQFLENIGYGIGPLIAGYFLTTNGGNYFIAAFYSILIGTPSILLWLLARKWIHRDIGQIASIIEKRSVEMKSK